MKTVLITGCSSGFGLETARYFLARDWKVIATMRVPRTDLLPASDRLRVLELDVTDAASIERAADAAGPVDALINNAGIGVLYPLEGIAIDSMRAVFETNTLGTMAVTRAMLPGFRARRAGVIVNVTSAVTLRSMPLLSVYTASKAAVNAFTESLALELGPLGIRTHLVLPGRSPETRFGASARSHMQGKVPAEYQPALDTVFANAGADGPVTHPQDVASAVWRAVTDPLAPLRLLAGKDAETMAAR